MRKIQKQLWDYKILCCMRWFKSDPKTVVQKRVKLMVDHAVVLSKPGTGMSHVFGAV